MNEQSFLIAADEVVDETIVTRSRFICFLYPCQSAEQAKQQLKALQALHPQANHHCYAFITDRIENSQSYGFSDDGEPSGTAGKPMLNALIGGGIAQVNAVVVRYFGGTKLGTGGLQRAYGGSVRQALEKLPSILEVPKVTKKLLCSYQQINDVLHFVEQYQGQVIEQEYLADIELTLLIPIKFISELQQQLTAISSGGLNLLNIENESTE